LSPGTGTPQAPSWQAFFAILSSLGDF